MAGRRGWRAVVWGLWLLTAAAAVTGTVGSLVAGVAALEVVSLGFVTVLVASLGALLAIRAPRNAIGWILFGMGVLGGLQAAAEGYADLALLAGRGSEEHGVVAALVAMTLWAPTTVPLFTVVPLLFPDGRLPGRRWGVFLWSGVVAAVAFTAFVALHPDTSDQRWPVDNPIALDADAPLLGILLLAGLLALPALAGAVAALVVRYRGSHGAERQQLKLVVFGGAVAVPLWLLGGVAFDATPVGGVATGIAFALVPVAIAVAILRYRLYDIDRLINRTVAYGLTVSTLGVLYGAVVVLVPQLLPIALDSPVMVAGTTLLVVSLFRPLTRRVQEAVDRRFDRRRYDAQRTLASYAGELRHAVDLDTLRDELCDVISRTMQPERVSLWLREEVGS